MMMTLEELKAWARRTESVELAIRLVETGWSLREALEWVFSMKTMDNKSFLSRFCKA